MNFSRKIRAKLAHYYGHFLHGTVSTLLARIALKTWGATVGNGLSVRGCLNLKIHGQLSIGANVRIHSGTSNFVGGHRSMAMQVGPKGKLSIWDGCALSNSTIVCSNAVTLLPDTFIGGGCDIYDNDFHQEDPGQRITNTGPIGNAPIVIGPKAFVGARCIILKGTTIGEGAVIGAGSVVTRSVPAGEIWAGVPARFIRKVKFNRSSL